MRFWRKPHQAEPRSKRELPALDESLWQTLRFASWRRGSKYFLGRHGADFPAFASQFTDYRPYVPGDDLRFLDARLLARTEREFVKTAQIEANLSCLFLLDTSGSMGYLGERKLNFACNLIWLGASLFNGFGDSFGLYACGGGPGEVIPLGRGGAQLEAFRKVLEEIHASKGGELSRELRKSAGLAGRHTLTVVISDFIAPQKELFSALSSLTEGGAGLALFQILTGQERTFPYRGKARFRDPETGASAAVSAEDCAASYLSVVASQQASLDRFARERGFQFFPLDPDRDEEGRLWLRFFLGTEKKW